YGLATCQLSLCADRLEASDDSLEQIVLRPALFDFDGGREPLELRAANLRQLPALQGERALSRADVVDMNGLHCCTLGMPSRTVGAASIPSTAETSARRLTMSPARVASSPSCLRRFGD